MIVLGIETSCDETAAAVVSTTGDAARPWQIRSNVIASQADIHREWGGVVPEIASRQHVRDICGVVERAMSDASVGWDDVDALAVTQGPGLVGSLLVGVSFAKAVAASLSKPPGVVYHLAGHIESIFLSTATFRSRRGPGGLGGHTSCTSARAGRVHLSVAPGMMRRARRMTRWRSCSAWAILGGPPVDRLAREATTRPSICRARAHPRGSQSAAPDLASPFPPGLKPSRSSASPVSRPRSCDTCASVVAVATGLAVPSDAGPLSPKEVADVSASFQRVVVEALVERTFAAAEWLGARSIGIAGGVSANSRLRHDALARRA
jgi:N6-L-threonylcarbamoyladenine synthase